MKCDHTLKMQVFIHHWACGEKTESTPRANVSQLYRLGSLSDRSSVVHFLLRHTALSNNPLITLKQRTYQYLNASLSPSESARQHYKPLNAASRYWGNIKWPFLLILLKNWSAVHLCEFVCVLEDSGWFVLLKYSNFQIL